MQTDQKPNKDDSSKPPPVKFTIDEPNLIKPVINIDNRFFYQSGHIDDEIIPAKREILALRTALSQAFDLLVDIKTGVTGLRNSDMEDPRFEAVREYIVRSDWNIGEYLNP